MFTEYHHIVATMIQQKWKNYIIQKKLWCMLKPDDPISLKIKKNQNDILNKTFQRIHNDTTHFRTMVIKYNQGILNKTIEINYLFKNSYSIYDVEADTIVEMDNVKILNEINNINNIVSIKMQAIMTNLNFYGYPEIIKIKAY